MPSAERKRLFNLPVSSAMSITAARKALSFPSFTDSDSLLQEVGRRLGEFQPYGLVVNNGGPHGITTYGLLFGLGKKTVRGSRRVLTTAFDEPFVLNYNDPALRLAPNFTAEESSMFKRLCAHFEEGDI